MRASITRAAAVEGPRARATIKVAEQARVVGFSMMIHVEVYSAAVGKDSVQGIPLNADVVHKFRLHIEIRDQVFGSMTRVDSVMAVPAASFVAYGPARTRRECHVAYGAKVGRTQIDSKIGVLHLNIIDPTLRYVLTKDGVISLLFEVAGIRRPGKVNR